MSFKPSPELYPFESRWLETTAARVHYVDEGEGRPILMCHGNPTWSFLYRRVISELSDSFRCIALDYPGFGLSEHPAGYGYTPAEHASVVSELVSELDLAELIVMGHDWGGPIGLATACDAPERVAGVVLGNTWFWPADRRARGFSAVMSSRLMQWAILERNFFVERIVPAGVARTLSPDEMEHYRAVQPSPADRVGIAEFPRQIRAAGPWLAGLAERVPRLLGEKTALVIYPMRDVAFPANDVLPRMRETFTDLEVVELPGAKHYFVEDAPREVAAAIRQRFAH